MDRFQESDLSEQLQFKRFNTVHDMIRFITRPWCLSDYYLSMVNVCHPDLGNIRDDEIELIRKEINSWQFPILEPLNGSN